MAFRPSNINHHCQCQSFGTTKFLRVFTQYLQLQIPNVYPMSPSFIQLFNGACQNPRPGAQNYGLQVWAARTASVGVAITIETIPTGQAPATVHQTKQKCGEINGSGKILQTCVTVRQNVVPQDLMLMLDRSIFSLHHNIFCTDSIR